MVLAVGRMTHPVGHREFSGGSLGSQSLHTAKLEITTGVYEIVPQNKRIVYKRGAVCLCFRHALTLVALADLAEPLVLSPSHRG